MSPNSGQGKYQVEQTLGPDEQVWLDVGKLIGNQVPDANGKTISSGVMSGTYELQSLSNKPTEGLFEGKLVVDKTYGYAAHGCMVCCGVSGPFLANDPLYVTVGGTTQQDVWATDVCSGNNDLITSYYSSWSTGNTQIATANVNQVSGVAAGSTTNNAYATQIPTGDGAQHRTCPYFHDTQGGPVNVQVPTSLKVLNVVVLPDGSGPPYGCGGQLNYGIKVDIKYQVLDQQTPAQPIQDSSMVPHENGTFFTGGSYDNDIGPVSGCPTSSKTTASDGTFHDVPVGICQNLPISNPGLTGSQNITIIMNGTSYPVRSQSFTVTAPGSGSFGHGTITNGSDISASR